MKIHLGCGNKNFGSQYVHIDAGEYPHVVHHDVKNLPYDNNWADEIYASHLFAYFDREEGLDVLTEWFRVLKPYGKLFIGIPDFKAMAILYANGSWPIEDLLGPLYGKITPSTEDNYDGNIVTHEYPAIYHKTCYDERSLSKLLHKVGFTEVGKVDTGFVQGYEAKDQSWAYLPDRNYTQGTLISLNLIATK